MINRPAPEAKPSPPAGECQKKSVWTSRPPTGSILACRATPGGKGKGPASLHTVPNLRPAPAWQPPLPPGAPAQKERAKAGWRPKNGGLWGGEDGRIAARPWANPNERSESVKIVFENETERRTWTLFLLAHRRWYKNHGNELVGMVEFTAEVMGEDPEVCEIAKRLVISPEEVKTKGVRKCGR